MDPLSHAAFGRTLLALADAGHSRRGLVASVVLGSLSPDVDAVLMPFGWDLYLRVHEIGTHTIGGAIACGLGTAAIVRRFATATSWTALSAAACAGSLGHLVLDLLSSGRLRAFWPIVDRQLSVPLVAMADPWLAALLGAGAVTLWLNRRPQPTAVVAIALVVLFLSAKGLLMREALSAYDAARDLETPAGARIVEAKWGSIREWRVMDRRGDRLRVWRTSAGSRNAELILSWRIADETKTVAASRALPTVRNFHGVHQLGFAVTIPQANNNTWILWSDIRYCWSAGADSSPRLEPIVAQDSQRLACGLWFGGEFDREGQPTRQLVRVFGLTQTRSVEQ
jgi:membrane-bound metal-dependent hydrolase YbcI (DUF457 family)